VWTRDREAGSSTQTDSHPPRKVRLRTQAPHTRTHCTGIIHNTCIPRMHTHAYSLTGAIYKHTLMCACIHTRTHHSSPSQTKHATARRSSVAATAPVPHNTSRGLASHGDALKDRLALMIRSLDEELATRSHSAGTPNHIPRTTSVASLSSTIGRALSGDVSQDGASINTHTRTHHSSPSPEKHATSRRDSVSGQRTSTTSGSRYDANVRVCVFVCVCLSACMALVNYLVNSLNCSLSLPPSLPPILSHSDKHSHTDGASYETRAFQQQDDQIILTTRKKKEHQPTQS
jgi:hypothetical protein